MKLDLKTEIAEQLGQLTLLLEMGDHEFPDSDLESLKRAFDLFIEGRLGTVSSKASAKDNDLFQTNLSLRIEEVGFTEKTLAYLLKNGFRYIGELYRIHFRKGGHKSTIKIRREVHKVFKALSLPKKLDVDEVWRPPYWDDQSFIDTLNLPVDDVIDHNKTYKRFLLSIRRYCLPEDTFKVYKVISDNLSRNIQIRGLYYAGHFLQACQQVRLDVKGANAWKLVSLLAANKILLPESGLWAAAFIPPEWNTPEEIPEKWLEELEKIKEEVRTY